MLNKIIVMGRLTADPILKTTPSGTPVTSFTIACDRDFKNGNGEKETDFIEVVAWRNTAEYICKFFTKGRMAVVSGRLQIRNYTDKDGNKRKAAEIVSDAVYFGDSKVIEENAKAPYNANLPHYSGNQQGNEDFTEVDFAKDSSDLPF